MRPRRKGSAAAFSALVGPGGIVGPLGEGRRGAVELEADPVAEATAGGVGEDERGPDDAAAGVGVVSCGAGLSEEVEGVPGGGEFDDDVGLAGGAEAERERGAGEFEGNVGVGGTICVERALGHG